MTDQVTWRKSSYSGNGGSNSECVELAPGLVRDSKNQTGPVLAFDRAALAGFLADVKSDRFAR